MPTPFIYLDNDHLIEQDLTRPATTTGEDEAATGLSGLTGRLSATDGGATIHASLSVSLSERSATAGRYYGVLQGADLRTQLLTYVGSWVWEVVGDGTNVLTSARRRVLATRDPG